MGVYIDMEMPKDGETVTITICADGIVFEEFKEPGGVFYAVPVPPHGRLIDADALAKLEVVPSDNWVFRAIEKAPTIIPASFENLPKSKDSQKIEEEWA